jgi:hypothetical protein
VRSTDTLHALVTFQNSMAVPVTEEKSTTQLVSLSNRYKQMMSWQQAFMITVRSDSPSMDLFLRQNVTSAPSPFHN